MSKPKKRVSTKSVHIRRCHICNGVTESDGKDVKACEHCGKSMAPFYFFNDEEVAPHSDHEPRPLRTAGKVVPILGFTAYW
ncbi:MAG: hypothetical protein EOP05_09540 [Proteobacteria bacterium]|nr:MAG: hypothetical protein EOP05_09540 [Pseudomonadota bacterium]